MWEEVRVLSMQYNWCSLVLKSTKQDFKIWESSFIFKIKVLMQVCMDPEKWSLPTVKHRQLQWKLSNTNSYTFRNHVPEGPTSKKVRWESNLPACSLLTHQDSLQVASCKGKTYSLKNRMLSVCFPEANREHQLSAATKPNWIEPDKRLCIAIPSTPMHSCSLEIAEPI